MTTNQAGIDLIKHYEGCKLTVYHDIAGLTTVGWGTRTNLPVGSTLTLEEVEKLFLDHLCALERQVGDLIKVQVTSNQFSALVSFAYNLGIGSLAKSTLLCCVNHNNFDDARQEFARWNHCNGQVVDGLTKRREAEAELFSTL